MKLSLKMKSYVETLAADTLNTLKEISSAAKQNLHVPSTTASGVFANINTLTSARAVLQHDNITRASREANEILSHEPAIARVIIEDDKGKRKTIYICRTSPIGALEQLVSYRAPLGRLASLPIGDGIEVPNGRYYKLLEKALLRPNEAKGEWDSENTILSTTEINTLTIESLRLFVSAVEDVLVEDLVEQMLATERAEMNVIEGVRRRVITKMALRDQPVLDQFQDEIFRLPLDSRLFILGPAGTGKTTTLIKRLGQKLDQEFLGEDDKELLATISQSLSTSHSKSWVMFTPTELLKQYLKEAFAKEGIAASDQLIKTWEDARYDFARNVFAVLKSGSGSGLLIMKESLQSISQSAVADSTSWFEDFDSWQRSEFLDRLSNSSSTLKGDSDTQIAKLGDRLFSIVERLRRDGIVSTLEGLSQFIEGARSMLAQFKQKSDAILKAELNRQMNRDRNFLASLFEFIKDLKSNDADDDPDELETEEDEESSKPRNDMAVAMRVYMSAVRSSARGAISRRTPKRSSTNTKIINWIGSRVMSDDQLREVGALLIPQVHLRAFIDPVKRYFNGIPGRYRAFRRSKREASSWYSSKEMASNDVHPLEVDIILLSILKSARELLSRSDILRSLDSSTWAHLKNVLDHYKTQVLVDEATDFSPVQLACMYGLSHPRSRSFFACGDFNQRLTTWGTRTENDMQWSCGDIVVREINVAYRQTRQLNDFSSAIIELTGGVKPKISLPPEVDNDGVAPALFEETNGESNVRWLARRIIEIESLVQHFPSIAVFVPSEEQVQPLAEALNSELLEQNFRVVPCPNGQVVGNQNEIRVFDIQHIKGLEFEAVFFVDLDVLAREKTDLFPGYLYVGSTRAATYLGITCQKALPPILQPLRANFVSGWQQ